MKVLYFVKGGIPSKEQAAEAEAMGALIRIAYVRENDFLEACDFVAGDVPKVYRDKYPMYGDAGNSGEDTTPPVQSDTVQQGDAPAPVQTDGQQQGGDPTIDPPASEGQSENPLDGMTVQQMRDFARGKIQIPAEINTKEEIYNFLTDKLNL